jgi:hypothetical protein
LAVRVKILTDHFVYQLLKERAPEFRGANFWDLGKETGMEIFGLRMNCMFKWPVSLCLLIQNRIQSLSFLQLRDLIVGPAALALTCLLGCSPLCTDSQGGQARSPDNMLDAIASYRDCGATTPEYTRITLQPAPGNHSDIKQIIFSSRNRHEVVMSWEGGSELTVRCQTCSSNDIELQTVKFRSVAVTYLFGHPSIAGADLKGEGPKPTVR